MKYTSKHNLEFHGIHEEQDEKMCELIVKLGNVLNVKIALGVIDICHRIAHNPQFAHKPRLVCFKSY